MANTTVDLKYEPIGSGGRNFNLPVDGGTTILKGSMQSQLTATSMLVPATTALSGRVVGISTQGADNSAGADADVRCEIHSDCCNAWPNGTGANACSEATPLFSPVYAFDDHTIYDNSAADTLPFAGYFWGMEPDGKVRVYIPPFVSSVTETGVDTDYSAHGVRGRTTANVANLASFTVAGVDGLTYTQGQRVFLAAQTNTEEGGIYTVGVVAGGTAPLTRSLDADGNQEIIPGMVIVVSEGTLYKDTAWKLDTDTVPIVVGTTALSFSQIAYGFGLVGAMVAETIGAAASAGTSAVASRIDHRHAMPASAVPTGAVAIAAGAEGTDTTIARTDHQHPCASVAPTGAVAIAAGAEGTDTTLARTDHQHPCASAAPTGAVAIAAGAEGAAVTLARTDHQHPCASVAPTGTVAIAAGAEGTDTTLARTDHQHPCASAAPTGAVAVAAGAEGAAVTLARTDHQHPCASAAPTGAVAIAAGAEGAAVTLARTDHQHPCASAAPGETGELNAEGAAVTLARTDHVHAEHSHEVRYVMTTNVANLAAFVVTQDGVVGVEGDLVLLANQTVPAESGVYVLGAVVGTAPLTRVAWLPAGAIVTGGYTVHVNEGTLFQDTTWFVAEAGEITIGAVGHTWYPETVTTVATLAAGTVTIATIPILSATHTGFSICRESANNCAATTGGYHPTVGGANAVTAGPVGTGTFTIEATVAAGTISNADVSDLYVTVINR